MRACDAATNVIGVILTNPELVIPADTGSHISVRARHQNVCFKQNATLIKVAINRWYTTVSGESRSKSLLFVAGNESTDDQFPFCKN